MLTLIIDWLIELDHSIFLALNGLHSPFWDSFNMLLTGKWVWVPMYATLAAALLVTRRTVTAVVLIAAVLLMIAITDYGIASLLRPWLGRFRPGHPESALSALVHNVNGYRGGTYGFPSCHAANSFALAIFMALTARKRIFVWFIFMWAIIHSYTRLYLGVHFPGDLIVGASFGLLIGWGMRAFCGWVLRISGDSTAPRPGSDRYRPWLWPVVVGVATIVVSALVALIQQSAIIQTSAAS
ncbi:MAG: phosphatase PAP2 family protein [Candidatus Amulumruptor caecigallinarius]|nr:phosphatase PAP2 family protein [Candidatus Amulumruptor caecigallinarius]MCM1397614.1 phosphatase PAP2 family protein [Candidatus Amulumruptor caecigallinarius]MCM1454603.1 phosphatase PAP2 family protein [bacterium]